MSWVAVAIGGSAVVGAGTSAILGNQHKGGGPFVSGGADERAYATQDFQDIFGRAPTAAELAQLIPAYVGADQHTPNKVGGRAAVAAYYQQQQDTPQAIYQRQQAQYLADAPKYASQVSQMFQSNLGRDATDAEKTHFGALMASGQDQYQIQEALQQTTEYSNKQTQDFTNQLKPELMSTNQDYFQKYILPTIQSQNAQAGRTQDSSGYQAQLANAAQQQNYDLQNYLAQIRAGSYQNSVANAAGNYQNLIGQQYGLQNAGVSNQLANNAANQQYNQNLSMYQMQQNAYSNYLNNYGNRNGAYQTFSNGLGLAGTALGAYGQYRGMGGGGSTGGYGKGPSQGSGYYNGTNNNPSNYGLI